MDCGCDDEDNGLFGEFNPDTRNKGWAPRFSADAGPDGCGGRCGRAGWPIDPNPAEDFPSVPPVGVYAPSWFGGALPEDPGSDQPAPGEDGDEDDGDDEPLMDCSSSSAAAECNANVPPGEPGCFCWVEAGACVCEPFVLVDGSRPLRPDRPVGIGFEPVMPVEPSVPVPIFDTPVGDDGYDDCKLTECDDLFAAEVGLVRDGCGYKRRDKGEWSLSENPGEVLDFGYQGVNLDGYIRAGTIDGVTIAFGFRPNGTPIWAMHRGNGDIVCKKCNAGGHPKVVPCP
jgi:hypothetical protein